MVPAHRGRRRDLDLLGGTHGRRWRADGRVESQLDHYHMGYMRRVKEPGWEELQPMFMLTPDHIRSALDKWGATGKA